MWSLIYYQWPLIINIITIKGSRVLICAEIIWQKMKVCCVLWFATDLNPIELGVALERLKFTE